MIRNRVQTILSIAAKDMRVGDKCGHAYRMEVDDIDSSVGGFTGTICARMKHTRLSGNRAKNPAMFLVYFAPEHRVTVLRD